MAPSILHYRIWVLYFCATLTGVSGQVATTAQPVQEASISVSEPAPTQNQTTLQAFRQDQIALGRQEQALMSSGATPEQLAAWRKQNSALFALQQQRAQSMAAASASRVQNENRHFRIPPNASPTLTAYLNTQAALANALARIHNQLVQQATASGQSLTSAQVSNLQIQETKLFHEQNGAALAQQKQQSQALANLSAQTIREVPAPAAIPPGTTPETAAYLTARSQMRREMVQLENQYANADPKVREAAMRKWSAQNAAALTQLQRQAQTLATGETTPTN
jgi:hypothetical protein